MIDYEGIGKRVTAARERAGLTQNELAEAASLSTQHISNIERSHSKLGLSAIINIANALKVSVDYLLVDSVYSSKAVFLDDLAELTEDASETEIKIMVNLFKSLLPTLRQYYKEP